MIAGQIDQLLEDLRTFDAFGTSTIECELELPDRSIPRLINEYWTARQRQGHSLHELSYRACFKPQLPGFFIQRLTRPGDVVYDPFMGRGTTVIEAALHGRRGWGADINPLSPMLVAPRLAPPTLSALKERLDELDLESPAREEPEDLLVFFHPETLRSICRLREHLMDRQQAGTLDPVDAWLRMVTANRLTGHSAGFLSVYTLPPNQAVSVDSQRKINAKRNQVPQQRDLRRIVLKKSRILMSDLREGPPPGEFDFGGMPGNGVSREELCRIGSASRLHVAAADATGPLPADSVDLVVTSPPFLDVVDYALDNWLRGWFCGIDTRAVKITQLRLKAEWEQFVERSLVELKRVLKPGGHIAYEVGEVHQGSEPLDDRVARAGLRAGLTPLLVLINQQEFTKTANCWGVDNNSKGTNSNRVVLLGKG